MDIIMLANPQCPVVWISFQKVCTVEVMKLNTAIGNYLHVALQHCLPYRTAGILILWCAKAWLDLFTGMQIFLIQSFIFLSSNLCRCLFVRSKRNKINSRKCKSHFCQSSCWLCRFFKLLHDLSTTCKKWVSNLKSFCI